AGTAGTPVECHAADVIVVGVPTIHHRLTDHRRTAELAPDPTAQRVVIAGLRATGDPLGIVEDLLNPLPERSINDAWRGARDLDVFIDWPLYLAAAHFPVRAARLDPLRPPKDQPTRVRLVLQDATDRDRVPASAVEC